MAKTAAQRLLAAMRDGKVPLEAAIESLLEAAHDGLTDATLDHDRRRRLGHAEVVFGQGKTPAQVEAIVARLYARGGPVFVTRAEPAARALLKARFKTAHVHETARTVRVGAAPRPRGRVAVVAAGTADLPGGLAPRMAAAPDAPRSAGAGDDEDPFLADDGAAESASLAAQES